MFKLHTHSSEIQELCKGTIQNLPYFIIQYLITYTKKYLFSKHCTNVNQKINSQPKYIPAEATRTVNIIAKLTLINHFRSVHPPAPLVFRIRILESVPDVDEDLENKFCSALPLKY